MNSILGSSELQRQTVFSKLSFGLSHDESKLRLADNESVTSNIKALRARVHDSAASDGYVVAKSRSVSAQNTVLRLV